MSKFHPVISIGFKGVEADFAITGSIYDLDKEQMDELRAMIVVAVGSMEDMWRRFHQHRESGGLKMIQGDRCD